MKVEKRPIADVQPYEKNAKLHPDDQVQQIANSIKEFGFNQPIVVDKHGVIIVGHGRFMAAHLLGLSFVPVLEVDLSEERAKAYRLADNKLNESEWRMEYVIEELKGLSMEMLDLTGFDRSLILGDKEKDEAVPPPPSVPRTALGDIYELGQHRLVCGDATSQDAIVALMDGRKADLLLTDPPYNVDYTGKTKDALKIENDRKDSQPFIDFLTSAFSAANAHMKAGASFYIWHADMQGHNFIKAVENMSDWHWAQKLIWNKNSMVLGRSDYHWKHEPCLYGWKEGASHLWNADRKQVTVLNFDRPSKSEDHPTMKPVDLLVYQIGNNTKGEDIVLDPFLGSGSTLIAAQKTGRICYGMELDPKYVDVVVQRYVDYVSDPNIKKNGKDLIWQT